MKSDGVVRQYLWFAFGGWAACAFPVAGLAAFFDGPGPPPPRNLPIEWLVIGLIPISLVPSTIFLLWIGIRAERRETNVELPWAVPLLLGVLYLPVCFIALILSISLGFDESISNGFTVLLGSLFFGLPAVFGEIAFRISQRRMAASASGRS